MYFYTKDPIGIKKASKKYGLNHLKGDDLKDASYQ